MIDCIENSADGFEDVGIDDGPPGGSFAVEGLRGVVKLELLLQGRFPGLRLP